MEKTFWIIKIVGCIVLFLVPFSPVWGQQTGEVKGNVKDTLGKALPLATIAIVKISNDSLIAQAMTDKNGTFIIKHLPLQDSLMIIISYVDYATYKKILVLSGSTLDLVPVVLYPRAKQLNDLTIIGHKPEMTIKHDTVEFNVSSYKMPPNSVVEDFLKKFPGLEIDAKGNMTYNGTKISRVLVNGQSFFGSNPSIALQNLPSDIVDQIQVMNTQTPQEKAEGLPSNMKDKTLNIKLKKGKREVGSMTAGGGTDQRYNLAGMYNRFEGARQLSFIGGANNVSQGSLYTLLGVTGIITTKMGGVNYSDTLFKKLTVNGGYLYNNTFNDNSSTTQKRQYIVPDSSFFSADNNKSTISNVSHNLNLTLIYPFDANTTLFLTPSFRQTNTASDNLDSLETTDDKGILLNKGISHLINSGKNTDQATGITLFRKFKKTGSILTLTFLPSFNRQQSNEIANVKDFFYNVNGNDSLGGVNQVIQTMNRRSIYNSTLSYMQPVSKTLRLMITESNQISSNHAERNIYPIDSAGSKGKLDTAFSTNYTAKQFTNTGGLSVIYFGSKFSGQLKVSAINTRLNNQIFSQDTSFKQGQFNLTPEIDLSWQPGKNKFLSFSLNASNSLPTFDQLLPVSDNTNPLLIQQGNPDLKPLLTYFSTLSYNYSDEKNNITFLNNIGYSVVQNNIINALYYDSLGRQVSKYINANGDYNCFLVLGLRKGWNTENVQKSVGLTLNVSTDRNSTFINGIQTYAQAWQLSATPNFQYSFKKLIDFTGTYTPSFNRVQYNKSSAANQNFLLHEAQASLKISWPKDFQLVNDVLYQYNSHAPAGFKKSSLLWNVNATKAFFKGKGLLKFSVYDLLKQNNYLSRTVAANYIEDVQAITLQRYFMLGFIYKFDFSEKNVK